MIHFWMQGPRPCILKWTKGLLPEGVNSQVNRGQQSSIKEN